MTPAEFVSLCETQLPANEMALLRAATIEGPEEDDPHGIVGQWRRFERGLRNALVRQRAPGKNVETEKYVRRDAREDDNTAEHGVVELARSAVAQETPLGSEDELNHARWAFLDDLESGYFFELERVIIYYIKLQILERRTCFKRDLGEEQFQRITEKIMSDYYDSEREQN
jgi:hypothetical protein